MIVSARTDSRVATQQFSQSQYLEENRPLSSTQ